MLIGVIKETLEDENRIAVTPHIVKKLTSDGIQVAIEKSAGKNAGFSDYEYKINGAEIVDSPEKICQDCNIFKIWAPNHKECTWLTNSPIVIADFSRIEDTSCQHFRSFALNKIPRISRAQSMDVLSSQNNLAGYKASLMAINFSNRCAPMMITSAGSLPPLKVLIWGLGVAGLQAAATAKRLGARVYASDIRPETKEQANSVGADFLDSISDFSFFDIIITCAGNYPNAPILITPQNFSSISEQTFFFDISGNINPLISANNIYRNYNLASTVAGSASTLFANNIYNFFRLIYDFPTQNLNFDLTDEIIKNTYLGEQ